MIPFAGGEPLKTLEVSVSFRDVGLSWTEDSKSIVYAEARGNSDSSADNIWSAPVDGGAPETIDQLYLRPNLRFPNVAGQ